MQIGIDHGDGERTVLYVEASRKGVTARSIALRSALYGHGRDVPMTDCVHYAKNGGPICLEDYPRTESGEKSK
jgi:hypothetical protein